MAGIDTGLSLPRARPRTNKVLAADEMAALFGLDMAEPDGADQPSDASKGLKGRRARGTALVSAPKPASLRPIPNEARPIITDKATVKAPILKAVDSKKKLAAVQPSTTDARTPPGRKTHGQSVGSKSAQTKTPSVKRKSGQHQTKITPPRSPANQR